MPLLRLQGAVLVKILMQLRWPVRGLGPGPVSQQLKVLRATRQVGMASPPCSLVGSFSFQPLHWQAYGLVNGACQP